MMSGLYCSVNGSQHNLNARLQYGRWFCLVAPVACGPGLTFNRFILLTFFQVQEYKDSLKQKAEHLIIKGFPEKIVKLNELLETPNFQNRDFVDVHQVRYSENEPSFFLIFVCKVYFLI